MNKRIEEIYNIIEKQVDILEYCKKLSLKKTQVIVNDSIHDLDNLLKAEQMLLMKITSLERKKRNILDLLKIKYSEYNFSEKELFGKMVNKDMSGRVDKLLKKFTKLINEQLASNKVNEKLIKSKCEYINIILDKTGQAEKESTYEINKNKGKADNISVGVIDKKI